MIGFYGLLAGSKARTEILPLAVAKGRPIYWSADISQPIFFGLNLGQADVSYRVSTADKILV